LKSSSPSHWRTSPCSGAAAAAAASGALRFAAFGAYDPGTSTFLPSRVKSLRVSSRTSDGCAPLGLGGAAGAGEAVTTVSSGIAIATAATPANRRRAM
jgi:hypothetical protein